MCTRGTSALELVLNLTLTLTTKSVLPLFFISLQIDGFLYQQKRTFSRFFFTFYFKMKKSNTLIFVTFLQSVTYLYLLSLCNQFFLTDLFIFLAYFYCLNMFQPAAIFQMSRELKNMKQSVFTQCLIVSPTSVILVYIFLNIKAPSYNLCSCSHVSQLWIRAVFPLDILNYSSKNDIWLNKLQ